MPTCIEHNIQALESALHVAFHTTPPYKPITVSTSDHVWNTLTSVHLSLDEDFPVLAMAYAVTYVSRLAEQEEGYDLSCLFLPSTSTSTCRTLCVADGFVEAHSRGDLDYNKKCTRALQCYVACISLATGVVCCQGTCISYAWMLNSLGISLPTSPIHFQMQIWRDLEYRLVMLSRVNFNPDLEIEEAEEIDEEAEEIEEEAEEIEEEGEEIEEGEIVEVSHKRRRLTRLYNDWSDDALNPIESNTM